MHLYIANLKGLVDGSYTHFAVTAAEGPGSAVRSTGEQPEGLDWYVREGSMLLPAPRPAAPTPGSPLHSIPASQCITA